MAMKRGYTAMEYKSTIRKLRAVRPEICLSSDFIVGFPGETEEDFEELLAWLDEAQLDRVGCFKYSPVQGATANEIAGAVPAEVMDERYEAFMALASDISAERLATQVGKTVQVLVDSVDGDTAIARTAGDAPEIDGVVNVKNARGLKPGEFAQVTITVAGTYDLEGVPATG
jgi:ribosomal protein S12 methylthiotransferase